MTGRGAGLESGGGRRATPTRFADRPRRCPPRPPLRPGRGRHRDPDRRRPGLPPRRRPAGGQPHPRPGVGRPRPVDGPRHARPARPLRERDARGGRGAHRRGRRAVARPAAGGRQRLHPVPLRAVGRGAAGHPPRGRRARARSGRVRPGRARDRRAPAERGRAGDRADRGRTVRSGPSRPTRAVLLEEEVSAPAGAGRARAGRGAAGPGPPRRTTRSSWAKGRACSSCLRLVPPPSSKSPSSRTRRGRPTCFRSRRCSVEPEEAEPPPSPESLVAETVADDWQIREEEAPAAPRRAAREPGARGRVLLCRGAGGAGGRGGSPSRRSRSRRRPPPPSTCRRSSRSPSRRSRARRCRPSWRRHPRWPRLKCLRPSRAPVLEPAPVRRSRRPQLEPAHPPERRPGRTGAVRRGAWSRGARGGAGPSETRPSSSRRRAPLGRALSPRPARRPVSGPSPRPAAARRPASPPAPPGGRRGLPGWLRPVGLGRRPGGARRDRLRGSPALRRRRAARRRRAHPPPHRAARGGDGLGLCSVPGDNAVLFDDREAKVLQASPTRLEVEVPEVAVEAGVDKRVGVVVRTGRPHPRRARGHGLPGAPAPRHLARRRRCRARRSSSQGTGWGPGATVRFGEAPARLSELAATRIRAIVPEGAGLPGAPAPVVVTVGGVDSNPAPFVVGHLPVVSAVAPATAAAGDVVEVSGTGLPRRPAPQRRAGGGRAGAGPVGRPRRAEGGGASRRPRRRRARAGGPGARLGERRPGRAPGGRPRGPRRVPLRGRAVRRRPRPAARRPRHRPRPRLRRSRPRAAGPRPRAPSRPRPG